MPIHLPPISRRRFLARSLAAGAGLALGPSILAANKHTDPHSWALLSDPHLAADRAQLNRGINMSEHFTIVSGEVLSLANTPAGVFINGDCAFNSGEPGDYAVLAESLEPLRAGQMPIHLTVGNHDNREHFWEAFQEAKAAPRPVVDKYVSLISTSRANWFVLDSLEKTLSTPGLLGQDQLDWLSETLDANKLKPALVMIHHNPFLEGNLGLKDFVALFEVIRPRKQVKAYLFGHTHTWRVIPDSSGIHLINLPAISYAFHEGEATGWVHADLEKNGMNLELRCVDKTHKKHGEVVKLKWRPG
jgi:3',5'-cyclic AMP phosphodiesterase CpdA